MNQRKPVLQLERVKRILQPQFEYLAKSHGEILWLHSFSVWSILSKLVARIPRVTDQERLLLEISALIHDIGKMRTKNQEILTGERQGKLKHTATKEEIKNYLSSFITDDTLTIKKNDIDQIWEFALHHHITEEQQKEAQTAAYGIYAEVIRYADWLSSMEQIDMTALRKIQNGLDGVCNLTVFNVGRYPSPTTYHLLQEASEMYHSLGWETLVVLDNGAIFIGDMKYEMPKKKELSEGFTNKLLSKSFEGIAVRNKYIRYEILSGPAKNDPYGFLQVRQNEYKDKLGDVEIGPVLFLRTLMDLYKNSGRLTNSLRQALPLIDILSKAGGTNGITQAKQRWNERKSSNKEWQSINALIIDIFNNATLGEVLSDSENGKLLRDVTPQELFDILSNTAQRWFPESEGSVLEDAVANLISMEEETDFVLIAKNALDRYKNYKKSRRPNNSLCEQCGFTVPAVATASLNFPKSSGFSQVNPRPESDAPRVVCPLCIFDASQTRKDLLGSKSKSKSKFKSQVYVRAVSRIPELWQIYGDLRACIDRLRQSLTNVREIKELSETEFSDLPLPQHFMIPIQKKYKESPTEIPLHTERGTLFPIEKVNIDASPKDLRAKYLAFYALLNMMGLEVHMGLEEQEGLFGERVFEKYKGDWQSLYYEGLVTVILAGTIDKNNKYIFAQSLLQKSPAVVLSKLEDAKIKKELLEKVFVFLLHTNLKITEWKGGVCTMKEILKDAAFFAEWVPKFFWSSKDYDSWRTGGSKYVVTKPVDRVLNALLQGDDFEEAFAKYLSGLKEDISGDKNKEGSKATVDVKDLEIFVTEAKKIFQRYADLRSANITKFIQAKNGLRSAIYIVKRYENLKGVIKNETA